ncbi:MAG TPA: hypothetical protein VIM01_18845 [Dermatophilaceae bacterium]
MAFSGPLGQRALVVLDVRRDRAPNGGARRRLGCAGAHRVLPLPTDLVLTTLLNELAAAPGEVWLVLDDYHLADSHDVRDGMTLLLEHLPPHVHVVLSTRADPDLPLARWRVRGELVEIRAADLRFTSHEAAMYLNEAAGLHLAAEDVEVLEGRTEGLDRRASARRTLNPGARGRQQLHRPVRGERPLHRRLPRRRGAGAPA